MLFFKEIF